MRKDPFLKVSTKKEEEKSFLDSVLSGYPVNDIEMVVDTPSRRSSTSSSAKSSKVSSAKSSSPKSSKVSSSAKSSKVSSTKSSKVSSSAKSSKVSLTDIEMNVDTPSSRLSSSKSPAPSSSVSQFSFLNRKSPASDVESCDKFIKVLNQIRTAIEKL